MKSKFYGMWEMGKCMRTEEAERMPEGWTQTLEYEHNSVKFFATLQRG